MSDPSESQFHSLHAPGLLAEVERLRSELERQAKLLGFHALRREAAEQALAIATAEEERLRAELDRLHAPEPALSELLDRRSISPKRLGPPAPSAEQIDWMLQAALRAPDHAGLHPWRVVEFTSRQREALADRFESEKLRRDPLAGERDRLRAREHATRPPALMAFVVSPRARSKVPVREQLLAAGAALCNLLNAAHQLGFGAIILSGERCFDATLTAELGVGADEFLAGFISLGTAVESPPSRRHAMPSEVWSQWRPEASKAQHRVRHAAG